MLRFTAVLANGSAVNASDCENAGLFWALRGGGGGTFAVVTSATYRAHPTPPGGVVGAFIEVALLQGLPSVDLWLNGLLALTPNLTDSTANDGGGVLRGYFNVLPVAGGGYSFLT